MSNKTVRVIAYGGVMAAALAAATPSYAELTKADRICTPLMVEVPAVPSASAGAGAPVMPAEPTALLNRTVPDRVVQIYEGAGPRFLNVDWGDTVEFLVRQPGIPDKTVKWRFDGLDNVVSFADIDPQAQFANDVSIYVNQSTNPLNENGGG